MLIYVVEENTHVNEIECYTLKNNGYETRSIDSAKALHKELTNKIPDMIIMEILLPDVDGIKLLTSLKSDSKTKDIPIIIVSALNEELEKVKCLDAGADDYITKPFGIMEFNSRVKALLRRSINNSKSTNIMELGKIQLDDAKRILVIDGHEQEVTFKEYELLKYLMINRGIVLSRDKIMEAVWGFDFQGESRTVDMHIKTLRQKIGEERSHIKTVRNVGYKID